MVEEFAARCGISNGLLWMLKRFGHAFRTTKPGNTFRGTDSGGGTGGTLSSGDYHGELCKSCRGRIMDDDDMHEEGARTCDFCGTAWRWCMAGEAASEPDHARPSPSPEDPLWRESSGSQKTGTTSRRSNWICLRQWKDEFLGPPQAGYAARAPAAAGEVRDLSRGRRDQRTEPPPRAPPRGAFRRNAEAAADPLASPESPLQESPAVEQIPEAGRGNLRLKPPG